MSTEPEVFCTRCGVLNGLARGHCRKCGAPLARLPTTDAPAPGGSAVHVCARCRRMNPADAVLCMDCGRRLGPTPFLAKPRRVAEALPDPLACPGCGTEMEVGVVFLPLSGFLGQVFADGPHHPLVFRRNQSRKTERVVLPGERLYAQRCPGCNAVWIGPPPERADPVRRLLSS